MCSPAKVDFRLQMRSLNSTSEQKREHFDKNMSIAMEWYKCISFTAGVEFWPIILSVALLRHLHDDMDIQWFIMIDFCTFLAVQLTIHCQAICIAMTWTLKFGLLSNQKKVQTFRQVEYFTQSPLSKMRCTFLVAQSITTSEAVTCIDSRWISSNES